MSGAEVAGLTAQIQGLTKAFDDFRGEMSKQLTEIRDNMLDGRCPFGQLVAQRVERIEEEGTDHRTRIGSLEAWRENWTGQRLIVGGLIMLGLGGLITWLVTLAAK